MFSLKLAIKYFLSMQHALKIQSSAQQHLEKQWKILGNLLDILNLLDVGTLFLQYITFNILILVLF